MEDGVGTQPSAGKSPQKCFEPRQKLCSLVTASAAPVNLPGGETPAVRQREMSFARAQRSLVVGGCSRRSRPNARRREKLQPQPAAHPASPRLPGKNPKEELWLDQRQHLLGYSQTNVSEGIKERRFSREEHFMFISNRRTWTSTLPAWCTEIFSLAEQVKCFLCWLCLPAWSPLHKSRFSRLVLKNPVGHGLVGTRPIAGFGEQPLQRLRNAEKVLMWFSWTCVPM